MAINLRTWFFICLQIPLGLELCYHAVHCVRCKCGLGGVQIAFEETPMLTKDAFISNSNIVKIRS